MPTLDFDPANKNESASDFPRLKLDMGEKARVLAIEKAPFYAYVHTLRAPKIVNGLAEIKKVDRPDGSSYTDFVKDFIGRPLCLGDPGILADKGVDPRNCPACARSTECSEVDAPARRFAMHVIRYQTKPNSWDLRAPFGVELVVWSYTDQIFNKLTDIAATFGNLREHDLLLGPCTNPGFQKFEIMPAPDAIWMKAEPFKAAVVETYKENRCPDLEVLCGRKVERRWLEDDIERIAQRWAIANSGSGKPDPVDGTEAVGAASLTDGLAELLGGAAPAQPATASATASVPAVTADSVDLGDLLGGGTPPTTSEPVPVTAPPASAAVAAASGLDFSDLLGGDPPASTAPATAPPATSPAPAAAPAETETVDFDALLKTL